ncbi:sugar transferase [Kaistia sp. UC242_56]|uniref:sugar transferase n=1 Tax=Kaistia sp. UC242_56 TaxID=3374625 RepID=UPI00378C1F7B
MSIQHAALDLPEVSDAAHGWARRALDLGIAGSAAIFLAPLFGLIALALYLEGGQPILFAQTRVGTGGRPFQMYKFRKFHPDCDTPGLPLTIEGDSRMTPIGRILAVTKLDELPQLWNVLSGDMAIVGPRPESLAFADCFRGGYEAVLRYKPGLLGPSQVLFRHEAQLYPSTEEPTRFYRRTLFPAKAKLDLAYFPHRTIASDVAWMARGAMAIFGRVPAAPNLGDRGRHP